MKKIVLCLFAGIASLSIAADDYIYLSKNNVNLREAPSTTAPVVEKGKLGTIFVVEEKKDGWYKGINAQYGDNPVWISSSVSEKCHEGILAVPAWNYVNMPGAAIPYVGVERSSGGEVHNTWNFTSSNPNFWNDEKPGATFDAILNNSVIYKNGSIRAYETFYKGEAYAYYLKLTEESNDGGESYTKLESPIYVYPSWGGESGIYVDGVHFYDDVMGDEEW
ncbi:MAG: hypothetical protein K2L22_02895 [Muribaculaceae bacterium]|nr:hypothetical protein [Muribaculaceae bacterium]